MKSILLIGLGRYGRHVARKLHAMHHEIMAVDRNEELVNEVLPYTNSALIADSTDGHFLESLGVRNFDACIVAIGDDFQSSLETTLRLRELGAKYIVARASSSIHEKFLLRNGADEVVYPEKQLALWTATRCGSDHLLDYFELSKNYAIYEIAMPEAWAGHTVASSPSAASTTSTSSASGTRAASTWRSRRRPSCRRTIPSCCSARRSP